MAVVGVVKQQMIFEYGGGRNMVNKGLSHSFVCASRRQLKLIVLIFDFPSFC